MKAAFKLACATKTWLGCQFFFLLLLSYCFCRTLHLPIGWNRSKPWNNKQSQEIKLRFNNRCGHRFQTCTWTFPSGAPKESWAQHGVTFSGNVCFQTDNGNSKGTHGNVWMFGLAHEGRIFSLQFPKPDIRQVDVRRPQLRKTGELSVRLDPSRLVEMFFFSDAAQLEDLGTWSFGNCFLKSAPLKVLKGCSRLSQSFVWVAAFMPQLLSSAVWEWKGLIASLYRPLWCCVPSNYTYFHEEQFAGS